MTSATAATPGTSAPPGWIDLPSHHRWLAGETDRLLDFYQPTIADPAGGFWWLGADGAPLRHKHKELWINARVVHCFALAALLGRPGSAPLVDHGLRFLRGALHDGEHGGWFWAVDHQGRPSDDGKQAYGHAFVLLAACSAAQAGRPGAEELIADALAVIDQRYWRDDDGLCVDTYSRDWSALEDYRGQNANMHMTEAFMAAAEATGDHGHVERAARIAGRLVDQLTRANGFRLAEHYDSGWSPLLEYNADDPHNVFRPWGSTVGHWLEWARLLVQLRGMVGTAGDWMLDAARELFAKALDEGWDPERGGFVFTVGWDGRPSNRDRYHWVLAEAIGAAVVLHRATGDRSYERWYQAFWDFTNRYLVDHQRGSWHHQLDPENRPSTTVWEGKPDLYHALQASLVARVPGTVGLALGLRGGAG